MSSPEIWLKGPLPLIPALLQPVAHALVEVKEEINIYLKDFDAGLLWKQVAGLASVGFHLQHIAGVQNRLLSYARGESLSEQQLEYLNNEGKENSSITIKNLLENLDAQTAKSLEQLQHTNEQTLTDIRYVGRKQVPSTVIGLLVHAAEHSMRHVGQLLVTIKVLTSPQFLSKTEDQSRH